ncbi:unnamed protein product, partial [Nesidiocoris tenuis]
MKKIDVLVNAFKNVLGGCIIFTNAYILCKNKDDSEKNAAKINCVALDVRMQMAIYYFLGATVFSLYNAVYSDNLNTFLLIANDALRQHYEFAIPFIVLHFCLTLEAQCGDCLHQKMKVYDCLNEVHLHFNTGRRLKRAVSIYGLLMTQVTLFAFAQTCVNAYNIAYYGFSKNRLASNATLIIQYLPTSPNKTRYNINFGTIGEIHRQTRLVAILYGPLKLKSSCGCSPSQNAENATDSTANGWMHVHAKMQLQRSRQYNTPLHLCARGTVTSPRYSAQYLLNVTFEASRNRYEELAKFSFCLLPDESVKESQVFSRAHKDLFKLQLQDVLPQQDGTRAKPFDRYINQRRAIDNFRNRAQIGQLAHLQSLRFLSIQFNSIQWFQLGFTKFEFDYEYEFDFEFHVGKKRCPAQVLSRTFPCGCEGDDNKHIWPSSLSIGPVFFSLLCLGTESEVKRQLLRFSRGKRSSSFGRNRPNPYVPFFSPTKSRLGIRTSGVFFPECFTTLILFGPVVIASISRNFCLKWLTIKIGCVLVLSCSILSCLSSPGIRTKSDQLRRHRMVHTYIVRRTDSRIQ